MDIYDMMHKTLWINIAAELLLEDNLSVSDYKIRFFSSLELYVRNNCVLCEENLSQCRNCPLYLVNFACRDGWYRELLNGKCDVVTGFYYALRCACIGDKENQDEWICDGVQAVLMVLRLKVETEEIAALEKLLSFIHRLPLSYGDTVFSQKVIKRRLAELKEGVN